MIEIVSSLNYFLPLMVANAYMIFTCSGFDRYEILINCARDWFTTRSRHPLAFLYVDSYYILDRYPNEFSLYVQNYRPSFSSRLLFLNLQSSVPLSISTVSYG